MTNPYAPPPPADELVSACEYLDDSRRWSRIAREEGGLWGVHVREGEGKPWHHHKAVGPTYAWALVNTAKACGWIKELEEHHGS